MDSLRDSELKDAAKACAEALASLAEIGRELAFRLDSSRSGYPWNLSDTLDMRLRAEEAETLIRELGEYIDAEVRREMRSGKERTSERET